MTTTIAGPGPLVTQGGSGTTPGYSALDFRRSELMAPTQEGVYAAGDYQVTQRAAGGAALFVDIAAGVGAFACVQGDSLTGQGRYVVGPHSAAIITEAIAAPNVSNPRIDIAVLEVFDNTLDASGLNIARVRIIAGSPTAGATLSSRAGVAALPGSALLLADILVTAGATSVSNTQIRDRRKWARGAFTRIVRTTANYATTSGTAVIVDATNLAPRVECSGVPVRVSVRGRLQPGAAGGGVFPAMDGVAFDGGVATWVIVAATEQSFLAEWVAVPAAGSHLFAPYYNSLTDGQTTTLYAIATVPLQFTVEEIVRQNTANNAVTSG